jgi:alanyl-tRNA synthetase
MSDFTSKISDLEQKVNDLSSDLASLDTELTSSGGSSSWPSPLIRQTFVDFFVQQHNHTFWASSPSAPLDDPTLLFANAGMNQFKPLFLGTCDPSLPLSHLKRAVNSQKCIRAGGKHNDLDDVGKDTYHHTFFEMLGNWSFGDYFKEEAIDMAWQCLVTTFHLDPDRIYATYFGGDESAGVPSDEEARQFWLKYLPAERILPFDAKDNFWEMGETGPCGPCSEIHYDRIGGRDAASLVNMDDPNVIEIWNVVFIQFNREEDGSLRELPAKHIDTGMGFERLTSILQGKMSNYDTDVFTPIFAEIQRVTGARPYQGKLGKEDEGNIDTAYRVLADHIRTLVIAITDGAVPSNLGRGYVLRRVLRRAVRYGQEIMGAQPMFFSQLVDVVVEIMGDAFPELRTKQAFVKQIISEEEESFNRTLNNGIRYFGRVATKLLEDESVAEEDRVISGHQAFFLYATLGFPFDLIEIMAEERGLKVDKAGFEAEMQEEKDRCERARQQKKLAAGGGINFAMQAEETSYLENDLALPATDNDAKYVWFQDHPTTVGALYLGKKGLAAVSSEDDENKEERQTGIQDSDESERFPTALSSSESGERLVGLVLASSSFYPESGGQIYDTGLIVSSSSSSSEDDEDDDDSQGGFRFRVEEVQRYGSYLLHVGVIEQGSIQPGDSVVCKVDYESRRDIAPNHTMTHVLNFAIRDVLCNLQTNPQGKELLDMGMCEQKGSSLDGEKLRFDYAWQGALSTEQLREIEATVNTIIGSELPVFTKVVPLEQAMSIKTLRCVFGERYPDPVRVVSVGQDIDDILANPDSDGWSGYSVELCGGTHIGNTRDAVSFSILEDSSISRGVRRMVAVTRNESLDVRTRAENFEQKVKLLEDPAYASPSFAQERMVKMLRSELEPLTISLGLKNTWREYIDGKTNDFLAWKKGFGAEVEGDILTALASAETKEDEGEAASSFVTVHKSGLQNKMLKGVSKKVGTFHKKGGAASLALFWDSGFEEEDEFFVTLLLSPAHAQQFQALTGESLFQPLFDTFNSEQAQDVVVGLGRGTGGQCRIQGKGRKEEVEALLRETFGQLTQA